MIFSKPPKIAGTMALVTQDNCSNPLNSTIHEIEILYAQLLIMGTSKKMLTSFF